MENTYIVEMTEQNTEKTKPYELHTLNAEHVIPMVSIIRKIGISKIKNIIPENAIKDAISLFVDGAKKVVSTEDEEEIKRSKEETLAEIGVSILPTAFDVLELILESLEKVEADVFNFLSSVSNLQPEEVKHLPLPDFAEMILDVLHKKEFKDFYMVVSKFFK